MALQSPSLSVWEHSGESAGPSPSASFAQVDYPCHFVKTMANIETHLVLLFSDVCHIISYDSPLHITSSTDPSIAPSRGGAGEVVWHNPCASDVTLYFADLQCMRLKHYDFTVAGLEFRCKSRKQKDRCVAFQEMLLKFTTQLWKTADNSG